MTLVPRGGGAITNGLAGSLHRSSARRVDHNCWCRDAVFGRLPDLPGAPEEASTSSRAIPVVNRAVGHDSSPSVGPIGRNHDSPLLASTLDTLADRALPPGETTVHLDRGYDSGKTRTELDRRGMAACIAKLGKPAPLRASSRWVVERTNAWHNAFKKLAWCTERRGAVIRFYVALANAIIIVRRLVREAWKRYRWDTRPRRCP